MELSQHIEGLRRELESLTRFAPDEVSRLAGQLAEALDSSVRLTLLDVLSAAAAEITEQLDATVIDLRLAAGEAEFVVTSVRPEPDTTPPEPAADDAGTARVTLRLSEALKARVEAQAAATGVSVNAWLAHAAIRALDESASTPGRKAASTGRRITGYARS